MKPIIQRAALHQLRAGRTSQITARGPHECVPLTPAQMRGAIDYLTQAACSTVAVPKSFFPDDCNIRVLAADDAKKTLLACYAHFNSDANLALSCFYRYRAMAQLASSSLIKPWVAFDPDDHFAAFHPALIEVLSHLPMQRDGCFDPEKVRAAAAAISPGFPAFAPPSAPDAIAAAAAAAAAIGSAQVDHRVAA